MIGRTGTLVSFLLNGLMLFAAGTGDYAVEGLKDAPPAGISEPMSAALSSSGYRVLGAGKPALDFWFRTALPTVDAKPDFAAS